MAAAFPADTGRDTVDAALSSAEGIVGAALSSVQVPDQASDQGTEDVDP